MQITRRSFLGSVAATAAAGAWARLTAAPAAKEFRLKHVLSTSLYGTLPVGEIVAQVQALGCDGLDIWAGRWGNQREQIEAMGIQAFEAMLAARKTRVCCYTVFDVGFLKAEPQMRALKAFGGDTIVCNLSGSAKDTKLRGAELKAAVRGHVEKLKPAIDVAGEIGVKLAIENHSGGVLASAESIEMLLEAIPERHIGVALAPYHLPQEGELLGRLVSAIGERLFLFYAWQHGDGSGEIPPVQQRRQLPGVGPLDFKPMLAALKRMRFAGWTSVFMHPTPRGASVHPTAAETTAELKRAHAFIDRELARV